MKKIVVVGFSVLILVLFSCFIEQNTLIVFDCILPAAVMALLAFTVSGCILAIKKNPTTVFISRLLIFTFIFRLLTALFVYLLEYHILDLPKIYGIAHIGIDNDNLLYHFMGLGYADKFDSFEIVDFLSSLGLFPASNDGAVHRVNIYSFVVGVFYYLFGARMLVPIFFNCFLSSFNPVFSYLIAKEAGLTEAKSRFLGYIVAFSLTISAYSSVLMRDAFIMFFTMASIYLIIRLLKTQNIFYFGWFCLAIFFLSRFRGYAVSAIIISAITSVVLSKITPKLTRTNISLAFGIMILGLLSFKFSNLLGFDYVKYLVSDTGNMLHISDIGYSGADSSFGFNRAALANNLPLLGSLGLFCAMFSPFPWQWLLAKNIVQAFVSVEMIVYYVFIIPSLFYGIKKIFAEKNLPLLICFFFAVFILVFYGLIFDNSGAIFRGRSQFLPLIFMICIYDSRGWLLKIENILKRLRIR